MVGPRGSSSQRATSGRAPSGCAASGSRTAISPGSGSRSAITTAATSGSKSATAATDRTMANPIAWQLATVAAIRDETPTVRSFTLALPGRPGHRAGQHVDLRLTAEDGYSVERSYSIASEPERTGAIDLTVERLPDGEASAFLHDVVVVGDRLEIRGPIGGYFVWDVSVGGPLLLVAGGSGVVPLMAMVRHRTRSGSTVPARLLLSSRHVEEIIYREELEGLAA